MLFLLIFYGLKNTDKIKFILYGTTFSHSKHSKVKKEYFGKSKSLIGIHSGLRSLHSNPIPAPSVHCPCSVQKDPSPSCLPPPLPHLCVKFGFQLHLALAVAHQQHHHHQHPRQQQLNGYAAPAPPSNGYASASNGWLVGGPHAANAAIVVADDAASTSSAARLLLLNGGAGALSDRSRRAHWEQEQLMLMNGASRSAPLSRSSSRYSMQELNAIAANGYQNGGGTSASGGCHICDMLLPADTVGPVR